jgi:hypothetical protein
MAVTRGLKSARVEHCVANCRLYFDFRMAAAAKEVKKDKSHKTLKDPKDICTQRPIKCPFCRKGDVWKYSAQYHFRHAHSMVIQHDRPPTGGLPD